jgi:hypothetical protein
LVMASVMICTTQQSAAGRVAIASKGIRCCILE